MAPQAVARGSRDENPRDIGLGALLLEDLRTHGGRLLAPGFLAVAVHRFGNWRILRACRSRSDRHAHASLYSAAFHAVRLGFGIDLPYVVRLGVPSRRAHRAPRRRRPRRALDRKRRRDPPLRHPGCQEPRRQGRQAHRRGRRGDRPTRVRVRRRHHVGHHTLVCTASTVGPDERAAALHRPRCPRPHRRPARSHERTSLPRRGRLRARARRRGWDTSRPMPRMCVKSGSKRIASGSEMAKVRSRNAIISTAPTESIKPASQRLTSRVKQSSSGRTRKRSRTNSSTVRSCSSCMSASSPGRTRVKQIEGPRGSSA